MAEAPGPKVTYGAEVPEIQIVDAYQLPQSDRYTAVGQFDVDIDFYIASPTDTPRYTLRYGLRYNYSPITGYAEYQDMLHLQRTGDGAYYVAIYPHKPTDAVPRFATLGDGYIIKTSGAFGIDYSFLSATRAEASGEGAFFHGTAGPIQDRESGLLLALGARGEVRYERYGLSAKAACAMRVLPDRLVVELPADHPRTQIRVTAPGTWKLHGATDGLTLQVRGSTHLLLVPAGIRAVTLGHN